MSGKRSWVAGGVVGAAVAAVLLGGQPTTGQPPVAPTAAVGRYQMQATGQAPNSTVFVLDSHTGQVWYRQTVTDAWVNLGTPVKGRDDKGH